jgi:hypothetical protein
MAWVWRVEGDGSAQDGNSGPSFESQAAAEAWLTSAYAELSEQGARAVSLYEEDRLVYGPMSLDAD